MYKNVHGSFVWSRRYSKTNVCGIFILGYYIKLKSPEIVEEIEVDSVSKSENSVSKLNIENIVAKIKFFLNVRGFFAQIAADYDICYYSYQIAKEVLKIKL